MADAALLRFVDLASRRLIDEKTGIIRAVSEVRAAPGGAGLFQFTARSRNRDDFDIDSGGASTSRERALAKVVGEAVERYCAGSYEPSDIVRSSFVEADFAGVAPADFAIYTQAQLNEAGFPLVGFERHTKVGWTAAVDMFTGERCFVPAVKVFFPYRADAEAGEAAVFQNITTGLACHQSFERAAVGAICEVIERDAFTITWQARLAPPAVRLASLDAASRELVARYTRSGAQIRVLNITLDLGVPTLLVVHRSTAPGEPALIFAAASDPSPRTALQKCLEELQLMQSFARWVMTERQLPSGPDQVRSRDDHVRYFCATENAGKADFLFAAHATVDLDAIEPVAEVTPRQQLRALVHRLHAAGHRVLVADLTTTDIAPLGLSVVRAIVPGLQPLVFGHRLRALACPRLWTVPSRLGYAGPMPGGADNPAPHPFP